MTRRFLGKQYQHPTKLPPKAAGKPMPRFRMFTSLLPVVMIGVSLYAGVAGHFLDRTTRLSNQGISRDFAVSAQRDLGGILAANRTRKLATSQTGPNGTTNGTGNQTTGNPPANAPADRCADFNANTIFPLLPQSVVQRADGTDGTGCTPPFWNMRVFMVIAFKMLGLANWAAGALAVILTVYAGTLYLTGFANEGNVKKAKGVLIGAYTGLILVFSARLLVYGLVEQISGGADASTVTQQHQIIEDANRGITTDGNTQ